MANDLENRFEQPVESGQESGQESSASSEAMTEMESRTSNFGSGKRDEPSELVLTPINDVINDVAQTGMDNILRGGEGHSAGRVDQRQTRAADQYMQPTRDSGAGQQLPNGSDNGKPAGNAEQPRAGDWELAQAPNNAQDGQQRGETRRVNPDTGERHFPGLERQEQNAQRANNNEVLSNRQLGANWDRAVGTTNADRFAETNAQMTRATQEAFRQNGLQGVNDMIVAVNDNVKTRMHGPMLTQDASGFTLHNVEAMSKQDYDRLRAANPQRTDLGEGPIVGSKGETMYWRNLSAPQRIDPYGTERTLSREQQQQVNDIADRHTQGLPERERMAVLQGLTAAMRHDLPGLSRTLPHAQEGMGPYAQERFEDAMKDLGMRVHVGEFGIRSQHARHGSFTIVPEGSNQGLRLAFERSEDRNTPDRHTVEAVTVQGHGPGQMNRIQERSATASDVANRMREMSRRMQPRR